MVKTNAMRLLTKAGIDFVVKEYAFDEDDLDGRHAADGVGLPYEQVFKTLVTRGAKGGYYVFCIPVDKELDLKKAASCAKEKSIEMIHVKELLPLTGYMRGGCSPVGMKKSFPTFIDETAQLFDSVAVSGGARGVQIILAPQKLIEYTGAEYVDITF